MEHLSEESIEGYLLEPDRLSGSELERVYAHLKECPRCRAIHGFLKDFYARLNEPSVADEVTPAHQQKDLARPIILRPMKEIPGFTLGPEARITVLAAESVTANTHRFETKAALVSELDKVLMRIVHDRSENRYRVYLIAEDMRRIKNTKVSIPALGVELTTNEHGVAEFVLAPTREEPNWKTIKAQLAS